MPPIDRPRDSPPYITFRPPHRSQSDGGNSKVTVSTTIAPNPQEMCSGVPSSHFLAVDTPGRPCATDIPPQGLSPRISLSGPLGGFTPSSGSPVGHSSKATRANCGILCPTPTPPRPPSGPATCTVTLSTLWRVLPCRWRLLTPITAICSFTTKLQTLQLCGRHRRR